MPNNSSYTTAEIALVLRLYREWKQGKKLKYTEMEHQFLKQTFEPRCLLLYDQEPPILSYRYWYIVCNEPYYTLNRREVLNKSSQTDYNLYQAIRTASNIQQADQFRSLIYDGQPVYLLVQCVMIEMAFKMNLLPRRASDMRGAPDFLLNIAEELQRDGTFNV